VAVHLKARIPCGAKKQSSSLAQDPSLATFRSCYARQEYYARKRLRAKKQKKDHHNPKDYDDCFAWKERRSSKRCIALALRNIKTNKDARAKIERSEVF